MKKFKRVRGRKGWFGDSKRHSLTARGIPTKPSLLERENQILDNCPLCGKPVYKRVEHGLITSKPKWKHDLDTNRYYHRVCWESEERSRVKSRMTTYGIRYKTPTFGEIEGYIKKE